MLKLLVYGYSYGVRSSRKLERACHYNVSFMWLTGGLRPDFKTIAEFRRKNKKALKCTIKECAHICIKLELIEGNILFIDGSKMRANAGIARSWTEAKANDALKKIDHRIDLLLAEVEAVDTAEADHGSLVAVKKQLQDKQAFKEKLETLYEQPSSRAIFKRRKERAEHPFGHFKRNLNAGYFLLRGLPGVRAEMALLATCFNITRMITLLGVGGIKAALA